jgi:hypothetical protein
MNTRLPGGLWHVCKHPAAFLPSDNVCTIDMAIPNRSQEILEGGCATMCVCESLFSTYVAVSVSDCRTQDIPF